MLNIIKDGIEKNGSASYLVLILSVLILAVWGSFNFLSADITENREEIKLMNQKLHQIDKDLDVIKYQVNHGS
jgi:hypothetical protein